MVKFSLPLLLILSCLSLVAKDWPTFGGIFRNHSSNEEGLRTKWNGNEPDILWKIDIGLGYSSVVEHRGKAISQGYENGRNTLFCLDAEKGTVLWKHQYPCKKAPDYFQGGTRATPTVHEDRVYILSHEGDLYSLDLENGKVEWSVNVVADLAGERPQWGFAGAPLVVDDKVIVQKGGKKGSLVALEASTGSVVWQAGSEGAGYASPYLRANHKEIVVFNQFGLMLHRLSDGEVLSKYQHKTRYGINAAQPLEYQNRFLISSAYGKGAALVRAEKNRMQSIWESDQISSQMASLVRKEKVAFGIHGQAGTRSRHATLFCLEIETGVKKWEEKGFGVGTIILVDEILVILSDDGALTLAHANSEKFEEIDSFQVLPGKNNWTPPTYANGRMHCRSSQGQWVCLNMGQ